jgi:hypothetical protein
MTKFVFILILFLGIISCKKENICDCLRSTGKSVIEQRLVGDFEEIEIADNINLILRQDTFNKVEIECGEHLQNLIKTEIKDNRLYISNNNKCNWVRSYKKEINAYITFNELINIVCRGSGYIASNDTIRCDVFNLNSWDGSGVIDLTLKTKESYIREHLGAADLRIKGKTDYVFIWSAGYGIVDCRSLLACDATVISKGTNNTYLYASNNISAEIYYIGDIYYTGNPQSVKQTVTIGKGRLIEF